MAKKPVYREVQYIVGMRSCQGSGEVEFFPMVSIEGKGTERACSSGTYLWTAPLTDSTEMSLAYGAAQAICDRSNADLQAKGLNRLREVS